MTYLTAYLDACGRNGGKPLTSPELDTFLPWKRRPADPTAWAQPPRPGRVQRDDGVRVPGGPGPFPGGGPPPGSCVSVHVSWL
jgi:hypothetical protein